MSEPEKTIQDLVESARQRLSARQRVGRVLSKMFRQGLRLGWGMLKWSLALALLFGLALQFSVVQTGIVRGALYWLHSSLKHPISIESLHIDWWKSTLQIHSLQIQDLEKQPLIEAQKLLVKFDYAQVVKNGDVHIQTISLQNGGINLHYNTQLKDLNINIFTAIIDSLIAPKTPRPSAKPSVTKIDHIILQNFNFNYDDSRSQEQAATQVDYTHFGLQQTYAKVENLRIVADTVQLRIQKLRTKERKTGIEICQLDTYFDYARNYLHLNDLFLAVGNSVIQKSIRFDYAQPADLSNFIEKVNITADLDHSVINTDDLAVLASPEIKSYQDTWYINGIFMGKIPNFVLQDADIKLGKNTQLVGDFGFKHLPNLDSMQMDLRLRQGTIQPKDLQAYIPQVEVNNFLQNLGTMQVRASLQGTMTEFVTQAQMQSTLGSLQTKIQLALAEQESQSYYKGEISTQKLNLGQLLKLPYPLTTLDLKGQIQGTGFSPKTANFQLKAQIKEAVFNQYAYHNIGVDGKFNRKLFEGVCIAKDTNLNFRLTGLIDFNKSLIPEQPLGSFNFDADIERISLKALNFLDKDLIISTQVKAKMMGLDLDSLVGKTIIQKLDLQYDKKHLHLDSLVLLANKDSQIRSLALQSEMLQLDLKGDFIFSELWQDVQKMVYEYSLAFKNNPQETQKYYAKKKGNKIRTYDARLALSCQNINPFIQLFTDQLYVSPQLKIESFFENGTTETLQFRTLRPLDSISIGKNKIYGLKIDLETTKTADSTDIEAELHIESKKQEIAGLKTQNFSLNTTWREGNLDFDTQIFQQKSSNFIKLMGNVGFSEDSLTISFQPSQLKFLENTWRISSQNQITVRGNAIKIQNFALFNSQMRSSRLEVNGEVSENPKSHLDILVKDVELEGFANFLEMPIAGILNGNFFVENAYQKPVFLGEADVENLMYNKFLIGDLTTKAELTEEAKDVQVSAYLYRLGKHILDLNGIYQTEATTDQLNLLAELKNTDIEIIEPFTQGIVSKLRGQLNGLLSIRGSLVKPVIEGTINAQNGGMKVNYLGTIYTFEGGIIFQENSIDIRRLVLRDVFRHRATLGGSIRHNNFNNFVFDLKGRFSDFALLNTTIQDNNLFYGRAYATGSLEVQGTLQQIILNIAARSEKDTKIVLPLFTSSDVGSSDFIEYVSFKGDTIKKEVSPKINLSGIALNFNLELNNNAEIEIIFDNRTGDIMRGSGRGNLQMKIDTRGDFGMLGTYSIQEGSYNFTLAGILSKPFRVIPGSKITFVGDILESILDIDAVYEKPISLAPLVQTDNPNDLQNPEFLRRYPIGVLLDLNGKLLSPEIKLGLDLQKAKSTPNPTLQTALANFESRIQSDEQELKRQAAGILLMNSLFRENSFVGASSTSALNSISEFVSSQLSHLLSQVDENLDLNLDINSQDINASRMRFSYRMLDGRLRVTREGGFTNAQNQADFANIVGDWTIEYLLSKEGQLRAKMYTRNNQNLAQTFGTTAAPSNTLTGLSLMHTASFNTFKELTQKKAKSSKTNTSRRQNTTYKPKNTIDIDEDKVTIAKKDTSLKNLRGYLRNRLGALTFKRDTLRDDNEQMPDFYQPNTNPQHTNRDSSNIAQPNGKPTAQPSKNNPKSIEQGDEDNEPIPDYAKPQTKPTDKKETTPTQKPKEKPKTTPKKGLEGDEDNEPAPEYKPKKADEKPKKED